MTGQDLLPHYVVDQWRLSIVKGVINVDAIHVAFTVEKSFLPLKVIPVLRSTFTDTHNTGVLMYRNLMRVLESAGTIDISWMNLILFDVSEFLLPPGQMIFDNGGVIAAVANYDILLLHLIKI